MRFCSFTLPASFGRFLLWRRFVHTHTCRSRFDLLTRSFVCIGLHWIFVFWFPFLWIRAVSFCLSFVCVLLFFLSLLLSLSLSLCLSAWDVLPSFSALSSWAVSFSFLFVIQIEVFFFFCSCISYLLSEIIVFFLSLMFLHTQKASASARDKKILSACLFFPTFTERALFVFYFNNM